MLTPVTRRQMDLSTRLTRKLAGATIDELREVTEQCLNRDKTWVKVSKQALLRVESDKGLKVDATAVAVRSAFDLVRRGDSVSAERVLQVAINQAKDSDMKAWLMVRLAEVKHMADPIGSQKILVAAKRKNAGVLKPIDGVTFRKLLPPTINQAALVQTVHRKGFILPDKRILEAQSISDDLVFDMNRTKEFESAINSLGRFIGLNVQRPERDMGKGPDNLWAFHGQQYLVIEVKSGSRSEQGISRSDLGQLQQSITWFKSHYVGIIDFTPIMVHPLRKPGNAATFVEGMRIITKSEIKALKNAFINFCKSLSDENILNDITRIAELLNFHHFTWETFLNTYTVPPRQ